MAAGGAPADAEYLKEKGVEKLLKELTTELMKSRPKVRTRGGLRTPQRGTSAAGRAPPHCGHPRHANGVLHARCWRASRHTARAIRTTHACSLVRGQLDPSGQRAPAGCCGHLRRAFGMSGRGVLGWAGWKIAASGKRGGPGAQAACGCTRTLLARGRVGVVRGSRSARGSVAQAVCRVAGVCARERLGSTTAAAVCVGQREATVFGARQPSKTAVALAAGATRACIHARANGRPSIGSAQKYAEMRRGRRLTGTVIFFLCRLVRPTGPAAVFDRRLHGGR